jgi:hypothetical protein
MLHVVEIRHGEDALARISATMRKWSDSGEAQPSTYRYSLFGTATVVQVGFELEAQANAFARASGGTVLRVIPAVG